MNIVHHTYTNKMDVLKDLATRFWRKLKVCVYMQTAQNHGGNLLLKQQSTHTIAHHLKGQIGNHLMKIYMARDQMLNTSEHLVV